MLAVEQRRAGLAGVSQLTKPSDQRILAARYAFHPGGDCTRSLLPSRPRGALRLSGKTRRMKAQILKKFEDEIQQLDKELKTELPREIKRARELGDLRENAE